MNNLVIVTFHVNGGVNKILGPMNAQEAIEYGGRLSKLGVGHYLSIVGLQNPEHAVAAMEYTASLRDELPIDRSVEHYLYQGKHYRR